MTNPNQGYEIDRAWELQRYAIESRSKYIYFMVGLTFAILGLSIEITDTITWITFISWVGLLISAIWGIFYIQWDYSYIRGNGKKIEASSYQFKLDEVKLEGIQFVDPSSGKEWSSQELDDEIKANQKKIQSIQEQMDKIGTEQTWRFKIHIWGFMFGILILAIDKILLSISV